MFYETFCNTISYASIGADYCNFHLFLLSGLFSSSVGFIMYLKEYKRK